ncbi:MAG: TolC family protein [Acidobacteriaceae bacterium]
MKILHASQLAIFTALTAFSLAPRTLPAQTTASSTSQTTAASPNSVPDPRTPPTAKPGALTLAQVLDLARTGNPTILAAEQNLRAVRAHEIQAGVRQNPNLGFAGSDITEGNNADSPYDYSLSVSRLFERGDKRKWRLEDARATTAQTKAQLEDSIRQTELAVKTAFTHMLIAKQSLEISTASLKDYQHEVNIGRDRYKAGDLGKLDYERLDLQLGDFESDQANDIITLQQSRYQLQTLLGVEDPKRNDFDITGDIVPPNITQTEPQLVQAALANRPDYAAARFGTAAAIANSRLAIANGTADPTLEAEYDRNGTENSAGFSANIPLRIFDRNQGNKATARLQADSSRLTETAARYQVISDVDQAWIAYIQSKRLSDRYGQHYLDESRDVLSISQYAYEHGGIALIDYLDALREARSTTLNALSAYQQTWLAIHQLSAASATDLTP